MKAYYNTLKKFRNLYTRFSDHDGFHIRPDDISISPEAASDMIYSLLVSEKPCMITRFGSTELSTIIGFLEAAKNKHSVLKYIKGEIPPWWNKDILCNKIRDFSGFFPAEENLVKKFVETVLEDVAQIDILGSWLKMENYISNNLNHVQKIFLKDLEPFWVSNPWSRALEGKKVLVVHPFAQQIQEQYKKNREKLFANKDVLPVFELNVIPAVQSLGGETNGFKTWFDALYWMESEIDKRDYDICLIGCGAYGMCLAAHVKRQGKKAIHLAGALQLLFGIIGNRWENPNYGVKEWGIPIGLYSNLSNEYWIRPGVKGRPKNANQVEGACHW